MDITQLEKEILKAIDVERNILKKFIKKCFKEYNNNQTTRKENMEEDDDEIDKYRAKIMIAKC